MVEAYLSALWFAPAAPDASLDLTGTEGLVEAMRYSLLAGGKRMRPVLAMATLEALGGRPEEILPTAAALELIHTYSLIHDDLPAMDDDHLRRGRPTCHVAFGEDTAILAGDALYAEAIRLVCELARATAVAGMVGGQYLDLRDHGRLSPEALRQVHALKTGRLISASVTCAVVFADPGAELVALYEAFAQELGLLFQIVDDILDVAGDEVALGKPVGADERMGKATYVSQFTLDGARQLARASHERTTALLRKVPGACDDLQALVDFTYARQH
jgi:geranylgeranyl diphosphate synthase type II